MSLAQERIAALREAFPPGGLFADKHWNYSPEPLVLDRLRKEDEQALIEMEKEFEGHITFVSDGHFHIEEFTITNDDNGKVLFTSAEP